MHSRARIRHLIVAVLCSAFLSACMVGPKYHRPVVQTPNTFRDLAENPQITGSDSVLRRPALVAGLQRSETTGTDPHGAQAKLRFATCDGTHQRCARSARRYAFQLVSAGGSECQFQRRQREYVSVEIQFSNPCRGCCVSAGFLRPFATRHGGFSRRVVGDRRGSADGDPDSGQRRSERLFHLAPTRPATANYT